MAGLLRKTQQLFGGSLNPTGNLAVWGSLLGGSIEYSNDPEVIQSAAWLQGLNGALVGNNSPSKQDLNALFYEMTYQLQYVLSRGIPEYDPTGTTTYNTNDICRVGSVLYISLVDNNVGNAPPSSQWANYIASQQSPSLILAWVVFSGIGASPTVFNALNVSGVTKLGTGSYVVDFANALPSANYGFSGSAGVRNGQTADGGSNNVIVGAPNGATGIRSAAQCQVCCRETTQSPGLEDNGCISVIFFGS